MTISAILTKLLELRGLEPSQFERFLNPSLSDLESPTSLPGVERAAEVILDAVVSGLKIVVFGDYDCDGVCATAIMVKTLTTLGAKSVEPFVPKRLSEGYGMSDRSVARMRRENPEVGLVITVDNGINSVKQIAELKAAGISVVVTDHHLPTYELKADGSQGGMLLPPADALVDTKVAAPESLNSLCGAGIAFLVANQLVAQARKRGFYSGGSVAGPLLVLAGLATVTDIMPLLGQNRILVSEALRRFRTLAPAGLRELHLRAARNAVGDLTSRDFGFMLGPRMNAAGRLSDRMEALELILTEDREIVRELARIVDGYNVERKSIEQRMTDEALAKIVPDASAQVIDLPDGHPGVAGIVAARIMERLGEKCPVCVIAGGHGSARAPEGVNIRDAFVACDELLEKYGGHAAAGGFAVKPGQTDAFRERLCAYCDRLTAASPAVHRSPVEFWLDPAEITLELAEELSRLEPFGEANPEPVFGLRGAVFSDVKPMGADGKHLMVSLRRTGLRAVWWGHGGDVESLRNAGSSAHDLAFTLAISDYGERHVELRLVAIDGLDENGEVER